MIIVCLRPKLEVGAKCDSGWNKLPGHLAYGERSVTAGYCCHHWAAHFWRRVPLMEEPPVLCGRRSLTLQNCRRALMLSWAAHTSSWSLMPEFKGGLDSALVTASLSLRP